MRVFLLRHGEAADRAPDGSFQDDARELTTAGIERLAKACRCYARVIGAPRLMFHSPLTRARQSAEILREALGSSVQVREIEELRPSGRARALVDLLQAEFLTEPRDVAFPARGNTTDIVLVGHEPLLGDLLGLLTTGNERQGTPMGTGMLAAITFTNPQVLIGRLTTLLNEATATELA